MKKYLAVLALSVFTLGFSQETQPKQEKEKKEACNHDKEVCKSGAKKECCKGEKKQTTKKKK